MYVIFSPSENKYLGPSGKYPYISTHTSKLEEANVYGTRDKAKAEACEGELVRSVDDCLRGKRA